MTTPTFPHVTELVVRGYELDSFGHANNASYLNWLEHARWEMFRSFELRDKLDGAFTIVRHMQLDYKAETFHGDRLHVATIPTRVGNTSFVLDATIRIADAAKASRIGNIALTSETVLVCMKPGVGKIRVPDAMRDLFPGD